jgi:hypothetical protein
MTATSLMNAVRRCLASGALALTVLQFALLFAVPVSACCARGGADHAAPRAAEEVECCPPGTHPPGQCPRHQGTKTAETKRDRDCRLTCDAPHGPQFLLGATGVLPLPQSIEIELSQYALHAAAPDAATARPSLPDAPPPRA